MTLVPGKSSEALACLLPLYILCPQLSIRTPLPPGAAGPVVHGTQPGLRCGELRVTAQKGASRSDMEEACGRRKAHTALPGLGQGLCHMASNVGQISPCK